MDIAGRFRKKPLALLVGVVCIVGATLLRELWPSIDWALSVFRITLFALGCFLMASFFSPSFEIRKFRQVNGQQLVAETSDNSWSFYIFENDNKRPSFASERPDKPWANSSVRVKFPRGWRYSLSNRYQYNEHEAAQIISSFEEGNPTPSFLTWTKLDWT